MKCMQSPKYFLVVMVLGWVLFHIAQQHVDAQEQIQIPKDQSMMDESRTLIGVERLVALARNYIGGKLPTEVYQSIPVPLRSQKNSRVIFLYGASVLRPNDGLWLIAPDHQLLMDAVSGDVILLQPIIPTDLGVEDKAGSVLGRSTLPQGRTPEEFFKLKVRFYELYDLLHPYFIKGGVEVSNEIREAAREFKLLFPQMIKSPLLRYYQAVGHEYFMWLDEVARAK